MRLSLKMGLLSMKFSNAILILVILNIIGCTTNIHKAGLDHALVFKKWQALSEYAGDTFVKSRIQIVGKLIVEPSKNGNEFTLTNFQLTFDENAYQINLRSPQFQDKYICNGTCVHLTEYLRLDDKDATMLTRYFDKYEFQLFELYGDIFTLEKQISQIKQLSEEDYDSYLTWLISDEQSFHTIETFRLFLKQAFTRDAFIKFIQNPKARYSEYISTEQNLDGVIFADESTTIPKEMVAWNTNIQSTSPIIPKEMVAWNTNIQSIGTNSDTNYLIFIEDTIGEINQQLIAVGDIVCERKGNSFGHVSAIMGTELTVSMLGRVEVIQDGISNPTNQINAFNGIGKKNYRPVEGVNVYTIEQVNACNFYKSKLVENT
jgi:hypothetical protein